jgi:hypothetical protein
MENKGSPQRHRVHGEKRIGGCPAGKRERQFSVNSVPRMSDSEWVVKKCLHHRGTEGTEGKDIFVWRETTPDKKIPVKPETRHQEIRAIITTGVSKFRAFFQCRYLPALKMKNSLSVPSVPLW